MTRILTGQERLFSQDELIVTKTDPNGRLTYANDVFLNISGLTEEQALGAPHSIIRHPDMPKTIFRLLWDAVKSGREIFAYVVNRASNGDHYWVFAHVTPTFASDGGISGFHSSRRVPDRRIITEVIQPLYRDILAIEARHGRAAEGMAAGQAHLQEILTGKGASYDRFIFSLQG